MLISFFKKIEKLNWPDRARTVTNWYFPLDSFFLFFICWISRLYLLFCALDPRLFLSIWINSFYSGKNVLVSGCVYLTELPSVILKLEDQPFLIFFNLKTFAFTWKDSALFFCVYLKYHFLFKIRGPGLSLWLCVKRAII